jgi:hypothetical protein
MIKTNLYFWPIWYRHQRITNINNSLCMVDIFALVCTMDYKYKNLYSKKFNVDHCAFESKWDRCRSRTRTSKTPWTYIGCCAVAVSMYGYAMLFWRHFLTRPRSKSIDRDGAYANNEYVSPEKFEATDLRFPFFLRKIWIS